MAQAREFRIRNAVLADARGIAIVHVQAWQEAYRGQLPDAFLDSLSVEERFMARERWMREVPEDRRMLWVAETEGAIVGFANAGPARDPGPAGGGEIYAVYLLKDWWGTGAGRALFETAIMALKAAGLAPLVLWVLRTNARAQHFYEAAGWSPDGTSKIDVRADVVFDEIRYRDSPGEVTP